MTMDEQQRQLLQDHLDGSLPPERQVEVSALLARDAAARRWVAEHQLVWAALGEAFDAPATDVDDGFRRSVLERADNLPTPRHLKLRPLLAAAAVLLVALLLHLSSREGALSTDDQQMLRYLHVLSSFDVMQENTDALDLRYRMEVLRAFEGELEGGG